MLPSSIPGILPSIPQDEFQLPSLRNIDTKSKRKANRRGLPSLRSVGGRRLKKTGKGSLNVKSSGNLSRPTATDGLTGAKRSVSKVGYSKGTLQELLDVVKIIEEECLLDPEKEDAKREKDLDPFFKCKNIILQIIEETRELIEQRKQILESKGTTYEAIAKRSVISDNIAYLKAKFQELGDIYAQQYRQRKALKLSEEELDDRHKQINVILKEIELIHKLSKGGAGVGGNGVGYLGIQGSDERNIALSLTQLASRDPIRDEDRNKRVYFDPQPVELSEEDKIVLQRWKERDKEFDVQVAKIGDAIDRIAEVAVSIGETADAQSQKVEELTQQTDQAAAELQLLDSKLKKFMKEQNPSSFCCKLILLVLLMLLVCFVFSTVYARYIKKA